jgi:membrane protein DedA with SNARE-associated domain
MDQLTHDVLAFITAHPELAALVIGLTAFGESFAIISFFVPGTTVLVAAGTLVQAGALDPVTAAAAAAIGALVGDTLSFLIGRSFGTGLRHRWPFKNHPAAFDKGERFFKRYGWPSVFIGRFLGPLRAFVPLTAGMCRMPAFAFYATSVVSAAIWAPALLYSGYLIGWVLQSGWSAQEKVAVFAAAAVVFVILLYLVRRIFKMS